MHKNYCRSELTLRQFFYYEQMAVINNSSRMKMSIMFFKNSGVKNAGHFLDCTMVNQNRPFICRKSG